MVPPLPFRRCNHAHTHDLEDQQCHPLGTIIRDDCNGDEIRTDCGLVGNGCWESEINELAEVTCPRCRLSGGSNHSGEPAQDAVVDPQGETSSVEAKIENEHLAGPLRPG
jgi:hypothetical protein